MVKIKWSDFLNPDKKIAINCQTEEDAKEFLGKLDKMGVKWCDGTSLHSTSCHDRYLQNSCYAIDILGPVFGIGYADIEFYNDTGFDIYGYSIVEFVDDDPEKQEGQAESNKEQATDQKSEALRYILKAMAETCDYIIADRTAENLLSNAYTMKNLAKAFEIVSRTEV